MAMNSWNPSRRAALGKGPVFLYYFRWESPVDGGRLKSPHTIEIPFAFDNIEESRLTSTSPDAQCFEPGMTTSGRYNPRT